MAHTEYATLAELRAMLGKPVNDTGDDVNLQIALDAAARMIDRTCGRAYKEDAFIALTTATAKLFPVKKAYAVYIYDCIQVTLVEMKDSPDDTTYTPKDADDWLPFAGSADSPDYNLLPYNGIMVSAVGDQEPYTSGRYSWRRGFRPEHIGRRTVPTLRVTAKWGYSATVPDDIKMATLAQAEQWWKRSQSAWADTAGSSDFGLLLYTKKLDPHIQTMLEPFMLPSILAVRSLHA